MEFSCVLFIGYERGISTPSYECRERKNGYGKIGGKMVARLVDEYAYFRLETARTGRWAKVDKNWSIGGRRNKGIKMGEKRYDNGGKTVEEYAVLQLKGSGWKNIRNGGTQVGKIMVWELNGEVRELGYRKYALRAHTRGLSWAFVNKQERIHEIVGVQQVPFEGRKELDVCKQTQRWP
jgi:hypothetical protein